MFGVAASAAVLLASIAAPACSLRGGTKKVSIPADYPTADRRYTLLYSTLGYESAATKRVLIRQNDTAATVSEGPAFTWFVVDAAGSQVAAGHATYAGTAWSIPLWAADFSQVTKAGEYRMLVEAPDVHLATDPFPIDRFVMFKATYDGIALENTEARAAPIEFDNGYFAGNDRSGSVTDHAGLLVGLLESFARRGSSLNDDERGRTRAAIDRAVDYLLLLSDPESGEIGGQSKTRSYGESRPVATAAGLRGLSHFAALAQNDEPGKADRAFRRAKLAETWLDANAPEAYPASLQAAVDYDLYRVGGDKAMLDRATKALRDAVSAYDLRTMDRRSGDMQPTILAKAAAPVLSP
jgi:Cellulase N-terminal ig-like domain